MKFIFYALLFTFSAWAERLPICNDPATTFDYSISRNGSNFVFTYYEGENRLRREITDDDGFLTAMALHRSWQSHSINTIPTTDIRLLTDAVRSMKAYTVGEAAAVAADTRLSAHAKGLDTAVLVERAAQIDAFLVVLSGNNPSSADIKAKTLELMGGIYRRNRFAAASSRAYSILNYYPEESQVQPYLRLCEHTGQRTNCIGKDVTQFPECSELNNKFCGNWAAGHDQNPASFPPTVCHPENLGQKIQGSDNNPSSSRGALRQ